MAAFDATIAGRTLSWYRSSNTATARGEAAAAWKSPRPPALLTSTSKPPKNPICPHPPNHSHSE